MKISIIGAGYVGLVTGACLAEVGNDVLCIDLDRSRIRTLNEGGVPIHEPGLQELIRRNRAAGRIAFSPDVERATEFGHRVLGGKIVGRFGPDLSGRRFALWGLAFQPHTDDMREAPSRVLIADLIERGATVCAYDPAAMNEAKHLFSNQKRISLADSPLAALEGADALAIVTEWQEFRSPDFDAIRARLKTPAIFDGRNLYDPREVKRHGIEYFPIGRRL